ncbi:hypothetical protein D6789_00390 [Candidatus Woesearchaeota archaeon]|nr:MAG: hypothetical protein D6789_00390 [Candidatus Woesearchaeota archaeon]
MKRPQQYWHTLVAMVTLLAAASMLLGLLRPFYQLGVFFATGPWSIAFLIVHGLLFLTAAVALFARRSWAPPLTYAVWAYTLLLTLTNLVALTWKGTWFNYYEGVIGIDNYILYEGASVLFWPYVWYTLIVFLLGGFCVGTLLLEQRPTRRPRRRRRPAHRRNHVG